MTSLFQPIAGIEYGERFSQEVRLTDLSQIHEGVWWRWVDLETEARHLRYYNGQLDELFTSSANQGNGMAYWNLNKVYNNVFYETSTTLQEAALPEPPVVTGPNQPDLDRLMTELFPAIQAATRYWSVAARCAIIVREVMGKKKYMAVNPVNHLPIHDTLDPMEITGHVFQFPAVRNRILTESRQIVDQMTLWEYVPGEVNRVRVFNFRYPRLGAEEASSDGTITHVSYINTHDAYYSNIETLARELMVNMAARSFASYFSASPDIVFPSSQKNAADQLVQGNLGLLPQNLGDPDWKVLQTNTDIVNSVQSVIEALHMEIANAAGIPPSLLNIVAKQAESRSSRHQLLLKIIARLANFRSHLAREIPFLLEAMGAGDASEIKVSWGSPPLANNDDIRRGIREMVEDGIISRKAARQALGVGEDSAPEEIDIQLNNPAPAFGRDMNGGN